uniref:Uncharacterized protein n=1 Tax=Tetranychus urticae TaxID=32264 RepID=T1KYD6_TETUR
MSFIDGYQPKTLQPPPPVSLSSSNRTRSQNAQSNFEWRMRNRDKHIAKVKAREARKYREATNSQCQERIGETKA